jgi:hypothetical protein
MNEVAKKITDPQLVGEKQEKLVERYRICLKNKGVIPKMLLKFK